MNGNEAGKLAMPHVWHSQDTGVVVERHSMGTELPCNGELLVKEALHIQATHSSSASAEMEDWILPGCWTVVMKIRAIPANL